MKKEASAMNNLNHIDTHIEILEEEITELNEQKEKILQDRTLQDEKEYGLNGDEFQISFKKTRKTINSIIRGGR